MYPSFSPQRRELREDWNEQDSLPWDEYLLEAAYFKSIILTADFMGLRQYEDGSYDCLFLKDLPERALDKDFRFDVETMNFPTSWDWLMPVIDKIEELGYRFEMSSSPEAGGRPRGRGYGFVAFTLPKGQISSAWKPEITEEQATIGNWATTRINSTYLAVVEFIIWYNENK
jgi:hypothetical protein